MADKSFVLFFDTIFHLFLLLNAITDANEEVSHLESLNSEARMSGFKPWFCHAVVEYS